MQPKKRLPGGMPDHFRRTQEDDLRQRLSAPLPVTTNKETIAIAERALASVEALERSYLSDRNPVYAWDAIAQIHFGWETLGKPIVYPPWVLAYLSRAAIEIMGIAVNRPKGNRHRPVPPSLNPDGSMKYSSDYFRGVTAAQRLEFAMEALGFRGTRGTNPLERAYREAADRDLLRRINAERAKGHSLKEAIDNLNEPSLKRVEYPKSKLRRARRRFRDEKS